MAIELRDPTTGKIKPVYLIAGGGIVIFGVILLAGKSGDAASTGQGGSSGSGGVVSGGQSSDITQQLAELNDAIIGLAGGTLPEAPAGTGSGNLPTYSGDPAINPTNPGSETYAPINTYPIYGVEPVNDPVLMPRIPSPEPISSPTAYTEAQALAAIKARAIAAGFSGSASSVQQTYQQDLAKGYSIEQIVTAPVKTATPTSTATSTKYPAPTQAQLNAIKARAVAAGFNPTPQAILNTYYRYGG